MLAVIKVKLSGTEKKVNRNMHFPHKRVTRKFYVSVFVVVAA